MKSFAAIDFETANHNRSSICSVGVVIVENEIIVDKVYRLCVLALIFTPSGRPGSLQLYLL